MVDARTLIFPSTTNVVNFVDSFRVTLIGINNAWILTLHESKSPQARPLASSD